ncbi:NAD(P)-dependent oxidoreductase [Streptomyces zagrosensis]|uniref:3-hydroxyisobutyrate dehydrogenase-like beta-hydroxyacid dehydrogenase n=1 Tax=Streptomyces zagrosensis TaxID=1042984 RepID=A0A7W9QHW5_9ACTN|nr:NAD(P)-binding domain-containing protein [Streptomyces zagrosensis]MBB5940344.1 3-hydroxyisobutyrate dehydrogenase-like beta-hydroxyacid dehydrogenase [Streptomyces zagrosensis]
MSTTQPAATTHTSADAQTGAEQPPVTVLGLGRMGQALAAALLGAGHPLTVWNRSPEKAAALVTQGATLATSARTAVGASKLVIVCVTEYDAVRGLLDPLTDALRGRVLINLTSGSSAQARETASWAAEHGFDYLDGAIMAIPPVVGTPDAFLLYGGERPVYEAVEPTVRAFAPAGTTYLGADHGLSSLYDVALLGVMWGALNSFLHGAALLGAAKVEAAEFAPFANQWLGSVTGFITAYAAQIDAGEFGAHDAMIDTHLTTMEHLIHESEASGVSAELPRFVKALTDRAVAAGQGASSYAAMIDQFRGTGTTAGATGR